MLGDDREVRRRRARNTAATIWDVRKPPAVPLFSGAVYDVARRCCYGRQRLRRRKDDRRARARVAAARAPARRRAFVPTGQTGIMIAGWGISVDRVIADFAPGAAEQLVLYAAHEGADLIVVEGQGAINHPAYAPVTLALMYGARPMRWSSSAIPRETHIEGYRHADLGLSRTDPHARSDARDRETRTRRRHRAEHARLDDAAARAAIDDARERDAAARRRRRALRRRAALYAAIAPAASKRLRSLAHVTRRNAAARSRARWLACAACARSCTGARRTASATRGRFPASCASAKTKSPTAST